MNAGKLDSAIYMTTIDGNKGHGDLQPPNALRRDIMFQLLFWDFVCVADSQFLTNPFFSKLILEGQDDTDKLKLTNIDGIQCFCDLDVLAKNGFLHCVSRSGSSLDSVRTDFVGRFKKPNRVLSEQETDRLKGIIKEYDHFDLDEISGAFQNNLQIAFEQSNYLQNIKRDISEELGQMIREGSVNFDPLETAISDALKNGKLSYKEHVSLYNLIKSCYIPNVPNALGMHYLAKACFHPIWQGALENEGVVHEENLSYNYNVSYCCMFDDQVADIIPMEAFINVLSSLRHRFSIDEIGKIRKLLIGETKFKEKSDRRKAWDLYESYINKANQLVIAELTNVYSRHLAGMIRKATDNTKSTFRIIPNEATVGSFAEAVCCILSHDSQPLQIDKKELADILASVFNSHPELFMLTSGSGYINTLHRNPGIDLAKYYGEISSILGSQSKNLIIQAVNKDAEIIANASLYNGQRRGIAQNDCARD